MPVVSCRICGKGFNVKPNHQKRGWGKFCSLVCYGLAKRSGQYHQCHMCGNRIWRQPKQIKKSKSRLFFCSKSCQTIWRNSQVYIGPNHPNWKEGRNAYRRIIKARAEKPVCVLCQTTDSRVLAVHHIDKNRSNNSIDNLRWLCHNCHFLVHHYDDEYKRFMVAVA